MSTENNRIAIEDEEMDMISGGVSFQNGYATNMETGEKYLLKVDGLQAFLYINGFGSSVTEAERIQLLKDKQYI